MTATSTFSDLEQTLWSRVVIAFTLLPAALDERIKQVSSLTHFQFSILAGLSQAPDRAVLMSDIARHANASLSRVSHAITKLEAEGLVAREACPTDGRATFAVLTDRGAEQVRAIEPVYQRLVRELVLDRLTDAQALALGDALGALFPVECQRDDPAPVAGLPAIV